MDPYDCYDDYFYVKIPARMELYLSISVEGTSPFDFIRVYNNSGNEIGSVYSGWSYNRSSNRCYIKIKMNLNGGSIISVRQIFIDPTAKNTAIPYGLPVSLQMQFPLADSERLTPEPRN